MELNSKLKQIREGKSITLSKLAEKLEWPISKLSKIEGGSQDITFKELEELCVHLGESVHDIVGEKRITNVGDDLNMRELSKKFSEFIVNYGSVNRDNFGGNDVIKIITKVIPELITKDLDIDLQKFLVKGSGGNGQPAEVPWLSIFIRDITTTATKGLYLVFLVKADLSGMYLSLNQGFTYFKDKYGTKEGKVKIRKAAKEVRNLLNTIPSDSLFNIDLECVNSLGKGYEAGNIAAKYYSIDSILNDDMIYDIRDYITLYEELRGIIGDRTVEQFYDYLLLKEDGYELSEEEEVEAINKILTLKEDEEEYCVGFKGEKKEKKDSIIDNKGRKVYPRDPKIATNALKLAGYKCEVDENHCSFTRKSNGKNYTESHHLIPVNCQDDFDFSLDVEENVCSICSTCHNCIHYGEDEERMVLLEKLYKERKDHLDKVGLSVSFAELKKYYKIK
ncbi:DUF3578 domain-containing protein [Romboutsia weinsteinii]|uniref:DUF3578 domain-containing protein n=1 Tax=Romboutsia weinsteinii TaxID=2020949 RepID=A0A371IZE4_9FIRM|nr:DUF3578 domain-containing protein [Romboutsia weinsteinii]RDY25838.1 DUF3578 domain-containing protein [Romboutsia weinsteinii]